MSSYDKNGCNGSVIRGQHDDSDATGLDFIFEASPIEGEAFPLPMPMLVVDQRGEAAHVRWDGEGREDAPSHLPVTAGCAWRESATTDVCQARAETMQTASWPSVIAWGSAAQCLG